MKLILTSILAICLALPAMVSAEHPRGEGKHERMRTFFVLRLTEMLDLDDATALKVSRIFRESNEKREALETKRQSHVEEIQSKLESGDSDALPPLVSEIENIEREIHLIPTESSSRISKLLSPEQHARFAVARTQLHREMRHKMHRRSGKHDRRKDGSKHKCPHAELRDSPELNEPGKSTQPQP